MYFSTKKKQKKKLFLVNLHHFIQHYEARKDEEPICRAYKCYFVIFLTHF